MADDLPTIVVKSTPRPIWLAAGSVVLGLLIAGAFVWVTNAVKVIWSPFDIQAGSRHLFGLPLEATCIFAFLGGILIAGVAIRAASKSVTDEGDDVLTPLRKRLCGTWNVKASNPDGGPAWVGTADFEIEPLMRKLAINITIQATATHSERKLQISDISLNPRTLPYTLSYYVDFDLEMRGTPDNKTTYPEFEVFVRTEYQAQKKQELLIGRWYELRKMTTGSIEFQR